MKYNYCKATVLKFYQMVQDVDFENLSDDDLAKIDTSVDKWHYAFTNSTAGRLSLMTLTAEKMITSVGYFGPKTIEEKLYFYLKMVDPDFLFLEAYESSNTIDEIKDCCKLNFYIYDPYIIRFEKKLYKRLNMKEELWALERIKKNR